MKKNKGIYFQMLTAFSALALFIANFSAGAASIFFIYQPKLPEELKSNK